LPVRGGELVTIMDELELPEIALPAHQRQLRGALMRAHAAQRPGPLASIKGFAGGMLAVRAWRLRAAATAVLLLLAVGHQVLWRPGPAAAFVIVQVNPSIELGIDREQVVVSARGLDATGVELLAAPARLELRRRPLEEALTMLTDRLVAGQQVVTGGRVVLAVRMVREEAAPGAQPILARAQEVVQRRLAAAGVGAVTAGLVVDSALYQSAARLGFLPADYVELIALDLGRDAVLEVLALGGELGIPRPVFAEKLDTLAASLAGLSEVGVTTSQAIAVLRASARADLSLEASDAIVEGVVDLVAKGVPLEQALGLLALQHDPALRLDGPSFLKEVTTLMEALADLHGAGITADGALALMRAAIVADPTLEESGTIVAAVIDLVQAGVPFEQGLAVLALQHDAVLRLPPEVFRKEATTLLGALVDLSSARITGELALAVIRTAAGADPTLEEFARVVDAVLQLVEGGVAPGSALAKVQQALVTDPTLERFEELLGIKGEGRPGDPAEDQEEPGEQEPASAPAADRVEEEDRPGTPPPDEEAEDDDAPAGQPAGGSGGIEPTLPTSGEEAGGEVEPVVPPLERPEEDEGGAEEPTPDEPDDDEGAGPPG
jgi:hypothetical protein